MLRTPVGLWGPRGGRDPEAWEDDLRATVASVTAGDFVLGGARDTSLDLFAVVQLPS